MDNHGTITGRWKGGLVFPQGRLVYPDRLSRGEEIVRKPMPDIDYSGLERRVYALTIRQEMSAEWKKLYRILALYTSPDIRKRKRGTRLMWKYRKDGLRGLYRYWKD